MSLAGLPPADRNRALQAQLAAWQPFPESLYLVDIVGDQAQVFAADRQQLSDAGSVLALKEVFWPESLLREAEADGLALIETIEGFEGQAWSNGVLLSSRWWPSVPDAAEWLGFVRQCRLPSTDGATAAAPVPKAQVRPWHKPARRLVRSEHLGRAQFSDELTLVGLAVTMLLATTAYTAHEGWDAYQDRLQQQADLLSVKETVAPILAAREKALAFADQAALLTGQLQAPAPLEVLEHLGKVLPKGAAVKELDLGPQSLKVALELPTDVTRARVVADLEAGGWFVQVSEVKEAAGRSWVTFEMRLAGLKPTGRQNTDSALTRASDQAPEAPPSVDVSPPALRTPLPGGAKPR